MADVVFVALALAFFGLCWLYIRGCERIIAGGEEAPEAPTGSAR